MQDNFRAGIARSQEGVDDNMVLDLSENGRELFVGTKPVRLSADTRKWNPNSLRFLIGLMINVGFDGNRQDAAEELSKAQPIYASERAGSPGKRLTNKAIGDILNDDTHIAYWQIEAFASYFRIPVGALLLLSRLMSHVRDSDVERAESDIEGTIALADVLRRVKNTKKVTRADLEEIADCYPRGEQNELFR